MYITKMKSKWKKMNKINMKRKTMDLPTKKIANAKQNSKKLSRPKLFFMKLYQTTP